MSGSPPRPTSSVWRWSARRAVSPSKTATPPSPSICPGRSRNVTLRLRFPRWGVYELGDLYVRAHDRFDLFRYDDRLDARRPIRVFPRTETLRALVRPAKTQLSIGNQVARSVGQGIEFAGLRPFVPGDVVRSIDPKTTARRGAPWVREHHPERNADVVAVPRHLLRRADGQFDHGRACGPRRRVDRQRVPRTP